jgi:hypothetical protein
LAFAGKIAWSENYLMEKRLSPRKRSRRSFVASVMLVAFASRALIPPGYMPASDRPFSIVICWDGFPADVLARGESPHADSMDMESMDMESMDMGRGANHHHGSPSHSEHCVFGTACGAGPMSDLTLPSDFSSAQQLRAVAFVSIALAFRVVHLPQPRAPPGRLS